MPHWMATDDAEWCDDCQRYRLNCTHQSGDGPDRDQRVATDGAGVEYTDLKQFAATISGKLALDARAVPERDAVEIFATETALYDNRDRLRDEGYRADVETEHEPTRLLVYYEG